jgi:ribosomal protein S12 methylthiotransferase accessory factor
MQIHDIDFGSTQGAALLAASASNGPAIEAALRRLDRVFLMTSDWAPGLCFVGGQVSHRYSPMSAAAVFSLAGSGESLDGALASCAGESVERLSQIERPQDVATRGSLAQTSHLTIGPILDRARRLLPPSRDGSTLDLSWASATTLRGQPTLVPADWCLRRAEPGPLAIPGAALSTGCAAGRTFGEAAARALLELVERDAASLWWIGGRRAKLIGSDSSVMQDATQRLGVLRGGFAERTTWLLDITTDLDIPVIAALSVNCDGRGLACGFAARICARRAAAAAIYEMCQIELALQLAELKRTQLGDGGLNDVDRRHARRAADIDARDCPLLYPNGIGRALPAGTESDDLPAIRAVFDSRNIEAALVDLTRPDFGLAVVAAIAPDLQLLPGNIETARLGRVLAAAGGGHQWTRGTPLI